MAKTIFEAAIKYHGTREIPGKKNNSLIVGWTQSVLRWAKNDEIPWCSTFMNAMADEAGLQKSGKANARSWLKVGEAVQNPVVGDIVVFWRESPKSWKGHVAIYLGESDTHIMCLGGNQGNAVSVANYPKERLLEYRRLRKRESA